MATTTTTTTTTTAAAAAGRRAAAAAAADARSVARSKLIGLTDADRHEIRATFDRGGPPSRAGATGPVAVAVAWRRRCGWWRRMTGGTAGCPAGVPPASSVDGASPRSPAPLFDVSGSTAAVAADDATEQEQEQEQARANAWDRTRGRTA